MVGAKTSSCLTVRLSTMSMALNGLTHCWSTNMAVEPPEFVYQL